MPLFDNIVNDVATRFGLVPKRARCCKSSCNL